MIDSVGQYSFMNENPLFTAALIADLHTDGNYYRDRNEKLRNAFSSISESEKPLDAVIAAGDITNSGHISEYTHLKAFITDYLRARHFIPQMGNHDARGCSIYPYFDEATELFIDFCKFCGFETIKDKNYYHIVINGIHIIVLATEKLPHNEAYITRAQADWFDQILSQADKSNKPILVINHQPPFHRNGSGEVLLLDEGGTQLEDIMLAHASEKTPVLYISGHFHALNEHTLEKVQNIHYLNLPSLQYGPTDEETGSYGFIMEIYENQIKLRCRDFESKAWIKDYAYEIEY